MFDLGYSFLVSNHHYQIYLPNLTHLFCTRSVSLINVTEKILYLFSTSEI